MSWQMVLNIFCFIKKEEGFSGIADKMLPIADMDFWTTTVSVNNFKYILAEPEDIDKTGWENK